MSAMRSSEEILEQAARDGSIDISDWPRVLENVLQKLHNIKSTGAVASPPSTQSQSQSSEPPLPLTQQSDDDGATSLSQTSVSTNKENAPPVRPPVPFFSAATPSDVPSASSSSAVEAGSLPPDSPLPQELLNSYQSSTNILRATFGQDPPYTIQRLAELVLQPRKHYRFLPPFLAALDRAVSVTSPVSDFPLPQFHVTGNIGFLTNGEGPTVNGISERGGLGSDESLGGALLTPIPWIKKREDEVDGAVEATGAQQQQPQQQQQQQQQQELRTEGEETIDGPHGAGRIETVSVTTNGFSPANAPIDAPTGEGEGDENAALHEQELRSQGAVTQGELLRQEQTAGVVPVGQETVRHPLLSGGGAAAVGREGAAASRSEGGDSATSTTEQGGEKAPEERPHARGPEEIGMEDTGPQIKASADGGLRPLDMEAAAGRKSPLAPETTSEDERQSVASVAEMKEGDPMITEGNQGGVADTAAAAAVGEKRKRDGEDDVGKEEAAGNEDEDMADAAL